MKIIKVGRAPENDIIIQDSLVSANHLAFTQDNEGNIFIQDFMSTNGTFVNEQKIDNQPIILKSGDKVKIGQSDLDWEKYFISDEKPANDSPQTTDFKEILEETPSKNFENTAFDKKNNRTLLIGLLALAFIFIVFLVIWYFNNIVKP